MAKAKITVVKRSVHDDLIDRYINKERNPDGFGACNLWKVGQEFLIEDWPTRPDDFPCEWAWANIHPDVATTLFGGDLWVNHPEGSYTCCQDGLRPVVFKVERIMEGAP